MTSFSGFQKSI